MLLPDRHLWGEHCLANDITESCNVQISLPPKQALPHLMHYPRVLDIGLLTEHFELLFNWCFNFDSSLMRFGFCQLNRYVSREIIDV